MYRFFSWCQTFLPWDVQLTAADICNFSLMPDLLNSVWSQHHRIPWSIQNLLSLLTSPFQNNTFIPVVHSTLIWVSQRFWRSFFFNNTLNMSSVVFSFTNSVLLKLVLDPTLLIFLRQNNWRLQMKKSDAYFIKCHLYKPGFTPKNVHFKIQFYCPCWCQSRFGSLGFCCHVFCWSCLSFPQILVPQRLQGPVMQPSLTLGKWS